MRLRRPSGRRGIALIIVMVVILVLGILAGGFSYTMRVETRLAGNTMLETDLFWLGRSGVEMARYLVGQQLMLTPQFTILNQKWAGGEGNTNDHLTEIQLENNELGAGHFSLKITDCERKFNINFVPANQPILQNALLMLGLDITASSSISDSILDWMDPDDLARLSGAESSDYYLRLDRPYFAKNGPITDLSELLLVQGITPELFFGQGASSALTRNPAPGGTSLGGSFFGVASFSGGLADLFTTVGGPGVNINTASVEVLQMLGLPPDAAGSIVAERAGFDGVPGTMDDVVINPAMLARYLPPPLAQQVTRYCTIQSVFFEVQVDAWLGQYQRRYRALLRRASPSDVQILSFYAE
jgi:general secretion pathway protein K